MSFNNVIDVWELLLNRFKESTSETVYNTILKPIVPLTMNNTTFIVGVNNYFIQKWLEDNYTDIIEELLFSLTDKKLELKIENLGSSKSKQETEILSEKSLPQVPTSTSANTDRTDFITPKQQIPQEIFTTNLNPKYTFDNFVIGNSNRFAYAAAKAVSEKPGIAYNPLFIYAGVGLGKTHLMHAIGNQILVKKPTAKVLYISSEKFLNEIVTSIEKRTMDSFKNKYRKIDCLIIDDIQFLEKRERTLEEFFHTFNALYEENKQIIISSDRPPKSIKNIEDRLRSRFECGLMADIQAPDLETRIAILRRKAETENILLPHEVITLVASSITNNVREIEGAYTKIVAYAGLLGIPITEELAKNILNEMGTIIQSKTITSDMIIENVAAYFKIKKEDLITKKRTQNIANARHIAMYLCRETIDLSYPRIGEIFGGRDHSTVIHAYEKINQQRKKDAALDKMICELSEQLQ